MGNVPKPQSDVHIVYNGSEHKGIPSGPVRNERISYRSRSCRSCFSVHDPRLPVEKSLGNYIHSTISSLSLLDHHHIMGVMRDIDRCG
jgi:hypothetical protein